VEQLHVISPTLRVMGPVRRDDREFEETP